MFPLIRTREEILNDINSNPALKRKFHRWKPEHRELFLDACTGVRGVRVLYDSFFKDVMNPETAPERLISFIEAVLEISIRSINILANDVTRLADEASLIITDIVVELDNGNIVNVEIQKIGYGFLGERSACYSSDQLLRQYKRIRSSHNKKSFNYNMIKSVYNIVLLEKSPAMFHKYPYDYIHRFSQKSDTGLKLNLLQHHIFIPLDIFLKTLYHNGIQNKLDAWLTFFGSDEPEMILKLINKYPDFKPLYEHIYSTCLNTEDIMGYFSKELQILDRNTVKYMIDQLQEENDKLHADFNQLHTNYDNLHTNYDKLHNENINLRQQHLFDAAKIERYRDLYGELPET